jgi:hypothetical protein
MSTVGELAWRTTTRVVLLRTPRLARNLRLDMLWTMPLAYPLMAAIQSMCANIGRVTGKGLAANIKDAFPPIVLPCA